MSIVSSKIFKRATSFASAFVIAVSVLTAAVPFIFSQTVGAVPPNGIYVVSGDTAAAENSDGWLFNRDPLTSTPYEFSTDANVFGEGSLYVNPIGNTNASDKFVGENFVLSPINTIDDISFDYQLGPNSSSSDYDQIYMNVYANFGSSAADKFYDCRYDVLTTSGSTSSFTNLKFDPDLTYSVTTRGSSPFPCPAIPKDMNLLSAGSTIRAFAINVGDSTLSDAGVDAYIDWVIIDKTVGNTTYDFEPVLPPCTFLDNTTFDSFFNGSVNGQHGWKSTGPYDQEIVPNDYGISTFGCKSLRLSNAVTSGSFGDQTFSYSTANEAGEADSTDGGQSGGTRVNRYEAQFDIASTLATPQIGLATSVSPDRGDGSRMSYLRFEDQADGIHVFFVDVQQPVACTPSGCANFVETEIATIDRNAHTIKFVIDLEDGASNDVVKVYIDGVLEHTGTTWEDYYRFDPESSAEQSPRTIDSLLFRAAGTAVPANDGNGFLFDNVGITTSDTTVVVPPVVDPDPTEEPTDNNSGNDNNDNEDNINDFVTPIITNPGSVLGNETNGGDTDVDGATDDNTKTETEKGFDGTIAGIAWYWWLLVLAILGGGSWWIVGAIRRRNDETSGSK